MNKKDTNNQLQVVVIPEGSFEGNCSDCVYADWHDVISMGRNSLPWIIWWL